MSYERDLFFAVFLGVILVVGAMVLTVFEPQIRRFFTFEGD